MHKQFILITLATLLASGCSSGSTPSSTSTLSSSGTGSLPTTASTSEQVSSSSTSIISSTSEIIIPKYNVLTIQPYWEEAKSSTVAEPALPVEGSDDATIIVEAAKKLATNQHVSYKESDTYKTPIDKELFNKFGENQFLIFQGHGEYDYEGNHSLIRTGKDFDQSKYDSDPVYKDDVDKKRIISWGGGFGMDSAEAISAKYVDEYCPVITNSVVYLGQCESCHEEKYDDPKGIDATLVNSFLNKGAAAVIANTQSISQRYGNLIEYTTMSLLADVNPKTNKLYTIGESLKKAKEMYGECDPGGIHAIPTLFGDENFSLN